MLRNLLRCRGKSNFRSLQPANYYATKDTDKDAAPAEKNTKPEAVPNMHENEVPEENPMDRVGRVLRNDFNRMKKNVLFWKDYKSTPSVDEWRVEDGRIFPSHVDVLVIGGGAMGSSIAYWLKKRADDGLRVAVVEKDPTYKSCSTCLSAGGLRQQFSLEENIEMSLFGAEFIRNAQEHLGIRGEPPIDLQFHPHGYLFLASEASAEQLQKNSKLQNSLGANNAILTATQLKKRFPWLNTEGVALGCLGLEKEGWFDPWSLLYSLKRKAQTLGADYVNGEMTGFTWKNDSNTMIGDSLLSDRLGLSSAVVKMASGETKVIQFAICIIAAGAHSGKIARMANIGTGEGVLTVPLPVEPRKRFVYCFHAPDGPGLNTPLTIDPSGSYFRREGLAGHYIAGRSPSFEDEPSIENLDVDEEFFDQHVWPSIAYRVKAFENIKVKSSWAGFYEYNTFDANGIVGPHPRYPNLYFATGFSGHGIQQAAAVGRAITELIVDSNFISIDLTRLGFDRFITLERMEEANIV